MENFRHREAPAGEVGISPPVITAETPLQRHNGHLDVLFVVPIAQLPSMCIFMLEDRLQGRPGRAGDICWWLAKWDPVPLP